MLTRPIGMRPDEESVSYNAIGDDVYISEEVAYWDIGDNNTLSHHNASNVARCSPLIGIEQGYRYIIIWGTDNFPSNVKIKKHIYVSQTYDNPVGIGREQARIQVLSNPTDNGTYTHIVLNWDPTEETPKMYRIPNSYFESSLKLMCCIPHNMNLAMYWTLRKQIYSSLFLFVNGINYRIDYNDKLNSSYCPTVSYGEKSDTINLELSNDQQMLVSKKLENHVEEVGYPPILRKSSVVGWKIRVYEKGSFEYDRINKEYSYSKSFIPSIKIGYGNIDDWTSKDVDGKVPCYGFRIFPHMNIHKNVGIDIEASELCQYWMKVNENYFPIFTYDIGGTDSYGNPLSIVVYVDKTYFQDTQFAYSLVGQSYEIYTNHIDSKWAYFEIYDDANITIKDNKNNQLTPDETYDIDFCNLELSINYSQPQGVSLNYFSYKVYSYSEKDDEYILDYSSPNYYGGNTISYDNFFNDKKYKFVVTLVDVNQRIYTKTYLFHTMFKVVNPNQCVTATYYAPHHSIIVDWSKVNSINPTKKLNVDDYQYVEKDTNSNKKSLYIPSGSALYYSENDFHVPLNFNNASLMFDFYGTNKTGCDTSHPEILSFSTTDGFNATVSYEDCSCIVVKTNRYTSKFYLYRDSEIETIEDALLPDKLATAPFVWDESLSWNDEYSWKEDNRIANKWRVIITPTECRVIPLSSSVSIVETETSRGQYGSSSSSYIALHGEAYYDRIMILEDCQLPEDEETLKDDKLYEWTVNTKILSNFDSTVDLTSLGMDFQKISKVRVFKQIGSSEKLYEVANTDNSDNTRILEDFAVGDNCEYRYYIYPIIETNVDGRILQSVSNAMVTNSVIMNGNADNILGLRKIGDDIYEVDPNEVWVMRLNLEDNGYTLNTDKNFYDTLNKYNQEIVGNRKYITKQLTGMIGYIDCKSRGGFSDNYDLLTSWNNFASGASLKCLVDVRGLILPGNFEANPSIEYLQTPTSPAVANFTWRQKSDLDIIKIYGTFIPFNYTDGYMLSDSDNNLLTDNISELLYTKKVR